MTPSERIQARLDARRAEAAAKLALAPDLDATVLLLRQTFSGKVSHLRVGDWAYGDPDSDLALDDGRRGVRVNVSPTHLRPVPGRKGKAELRRRLEAT